MVAKFLLALVHWMFGHSWRIGGKGNRRVCSVCGAKEMLVVDGVNKKKARWVRE